MSDNTLDNIQSLSTGVNATDNDRLVDNMQIEKDNTDWFKSDIQAKSEPINDPGIGKAVIVRNFEFARNPEFKGKLTEQELFNMHWRQISTVLWGDGLIPMDNIEPRIKFTRNGDYRIFITCEARGGTFVPEKPGKLQDILAKGNRKR